MEKEIFYKKLDGEYKDVKLGYSINPETEECSLEEVLAPSSFRSNEDELRAYVSTVAGVDNDSITVSYQAPKKSIWSKIKSTVGSALKTYTAPVVVGLGLGIAAGAGAFAATGGKLKNLIHSEKTINENGTMSWDAYLNTSHSNNAYIELTLDAENSTYTFVGRDGNLKTAPYTIPSTDFSITGGLNGFSLHFMRDANATNSTYILDFQTENLNLNDVVFDLSNCDVTGGSGIINFNNTKVNGQMKLNGTELYKLMQVWTDNTNMTQDNNTGYVEIGNAQCPVRDLTWKWVLKQLNATELKDIANKTVTMNLYGANVTGNANITNLHADLTGPALLDTTHANNITGHMKTTNLEKILLMTHYSTGPVSFQNVTLHGKNVTVDSYNVTVDPDNPMVMQLAKNSTVKYKGNMAELYMHGEGKTTSTWKFNYENPHMLLVPMGAGFGLLGGLNGGNRIATKKQIKKTEIKRAYESGINNGIQRAYQDKKATAITQFVGQKDVELNEKIDVNDQDLNEKINDNHDYVKAIFNHPKTGVKKKLKIIRKKLSDLETKIDETHGTPDEIAKMNQDVNTKQAEA